MPSNKKKTTLYLVYTCHICEDIYADGPKLIQHYLEEHDITLPSRRRGIKRPVNDFFDYQLDYARDWDEQHMACPSCWYHAKYLDLIEEHIDWDHILGDNSLVNNRYDKRIIVNIYNRIDDLINSFKSLLK